MALKLVVGVAVAMAMVQLVGGDCDNVSIINGCSIPFGLDFPYKETFKNACNRHDVCYGCGVGKGISRSKCDKAFYDNMKDICKKFSIFKEVTCKSYAAIYYAGVNVGGKKRYKTTANYYCDQPWVASCLP